MRYVILSLFILISLVKLSAAETLPPLIDNQAPQDYDSMWSSFDPRAEPLEIEILKEWEVDNIVIRAVRYRTGIFKGKKAMMAAIYGFPKGEKNIPGLVQIHGGGQSAHDNAVITNAKRGYATISIAWAGRISASQYTVTKQEVQLFWDNATDQAGYKLTTDWGALDAYHAPSRYKNTFHSVEASPWTLDSIDSPRNNPWFLITLAARRALTFLEQQPEVDKDKLGVYGHSMGGKLTVMTTGADDRVKAAAPSCGGVSKRRDDNMLYSNTIDDDKSLRRITCPIFFLSPSNDFHGRIDDLQLAVDEINSKEWRINCSPHHNHQDTPTFEVATQLWFDQHLKNSFTIPLTPLASLDLSATNGMPLYHIIADQSRAILRVEVYYTQQGQMPEEKNDFYNTKNKFWHYVKPTQVNGKTNQWSAQLPIFSTDKPLWVYANVVYALDKTITGAGYYYGTYVANDFTLSSKMTMVFPKELKNAHIQAASKASTMIETFTGDWEKEWFAYKPEEMERKTHKIYDPQWAAPAGAKLSLEVKCEKANNLIISIDDYAAMVPLAGSDEWKTVVLEAKDFVDINNQALANWSGIKELRLSDTITLKGKETNKKLGAKWQGKWPTYRNLQWVTP